MSNRRIGGAQPHQFRESGCRHSGCIEGHRFAQEGQGGGWITSRGGPFGSFDDAQLQRGFKVYREVCSSCHSMNLLSFRNLAEPGGPGFSSDQVKALAAEYKVKDGPNDAGEMFERPGRLSDRWPNPWPNVEAAKAANGGAAPPDMSVIAKARTYERGFPLFLWDAVVQYQEHGTDYIRALLVGYQEPPAGFKVEPGLHYNRYFPGGKIAMAKPVNDGQVEYTDGSPATLDQYAKDVSAYLAWVAEPTMEARKALGLRVMLFLAAFAALMYLTKKKFWSKLPGADLEGARPSH